MWVDRVDRDRMIETLRHRGGANPVKALTALTRCTWRGHVYADNAPALSRWKPTAQPTVAWCVACEKRLRPRRDEAVSVSTYWSTRP